MLLTGTRSLPLLTKKGRANHQGSSPPRRHVRPQTTGNLSQLVRNMCRDMFHLKRPADQQATRHTVQVQLSSHSATPALEPLSRHRSTSDRWALAENTAPATKKRMPCSTAPTSCNCKFNLIQFHCVHFHDDVLSSREMRGVLV